MQKESAYPHGPSILAIFICVTLDPAKRIAANIASVRGRIADAAQRSGRDASEITLIAVTKYVDGRLAAALLDAGCMDLGESRPQELWRKADAISQSNVRWHLIGHLQRNKIRRTLPIVSVIHSGDNLRLLAELDEQANAFNNDVSILLEVNVSGDEAKHGFQPGEMESVFAKASQFSNLRIHGLMTMASREGDLNSARKEFGQLRAIRDALQNPIRARSCGNYPWG